MTLTRRRVNPIPRILPAVMSLCLWGMMAWFAYHGYLFYRAYDSGYAAGVRAGQVFALDVRQRNLRALSYTKELAEFIRLRAPRGGPEWKDALHRHAWETGLDSVMANVLH